VNDYHFLYKDSQGKWQTTTNPIFIAKHQYCRAVPKKEVASAYDLHIMYASELAFSLNNYEDCIIDLDKLISEYELY
jgi:hypothetical protein